MRLFRAGLTLIFVVLGREALTPSSIVNYIQIRRRKLRSIKYNGLKAIRAKQNANKNKPKSLLSRILDFPANIMCSRGTIIEPKAVVIGKNSKTEVINLF